MATTKPKRSRFEGFVHFKIDRNIQAAMTQLSKFWKIPETEVARTAVLNSATEAALSAEMKALPAKTRGKSNAEVERLKSELAQAKEQIKTLEARQREAKAAIESGLRTLGQ